MRRRGYHQREHTRENEQGTSFRAGQGTALIQMRKPESRQEPTVRSQLVIPTMMPIQVQVPAVRRAIQKPAVYKPGSVLFHFSYLDEEKELLEAIQKLTPEELMDNEKTLKHDVIEYALGFFIWEDKDYERAGPAQRKKMLLKVVDDEFTSGDVQYEKDEAAAETLTEEITDKADLWEAYDPQTHKASKKIKLTGYDLISGMLARGELTKRMIFYSLTKDGFAVQVDLGEEDLGEFGSYGEKGALPSTEWYYFMKAAPPGYKRDWIYGGVVRE